MYTITCYTYTLHCYTLRKVPKDADYYASRGKLTELNIA